MDLIPVAIWAANNGQVIWNNTYFETLFEGRRDQGMAALEDVPGKRSESGEQRMRYKLGDPESNEEFVVLQKRGSGSDIFFAWDATTLVKLESELGRFIQTLTETFAHLPIGLAVFDKKRDLSLFNPALSDLLGIPVDWLIRRPRLRDFLDRMRNDGALPEPKDFKSLRQQLVNLEETSA